jgi:hypothetical protein
MKSDDQTNGEFFEALWYNVCPHLLPFDNISSVFGMATSGASSGSFVESLIGLLSCKRKAPKTPEQ